VAYALVLRRPTGDEPREADLPPGLGINSTFELDGEHWIITGKTSAIEYGLRALSAFICESAPTAPQPPPPAVAATTPRVFISYSHADKQAAHALAHALETAELNVWIDERELRVGDSIVEAISRAIADVDFFLPLVSTEAMKSPWCRKELQLAMTRSLERDDHRIKVLPVRLGDVEMPHELRDLLYLEFDPNRPNGALERLVADIHAHYGDRAPVQPTVVAKIDTVTDPLLVPGQESEFVLEEPRNVVSAVQPIFAIPLRVPLQNIGDRPAFITDAIGNSRDFGHLTVRPPTAIPAGAVGFLDCNVSTISAGSRLHAGDKLEFEVRYYRGGTATFESLQFAVAYHGGGGWRVEDWSATTDEPVG
jgi:hypothetical protein